MSESQVWYEPHPVTPERKAEIRKRGYRIVDAAFAPEGHKNHEEEPKPVAVKAAATPKQSEKS